MSSKQKWRFNIRNLETRMRIGCDPKEHEPQRILVNVVMEGEYSAAPQSLEQCINYDLVYRLVTQEWPALPHTILLETRIRELLEYIFRADERISYAKVSLDKPDIFPEIESIGIEAEWTRADYLRYRK